MNYHLCTYGDPVLRRQGEPVTRIDSDIRKLADAMLHIMAEQRGVGLAAQQIGQVQSMCVIHIPPELDAAVPANAQPAPDIEQPLVLVNPQILHRRGQMRAMEGCLSIPEIWAPVMRAAEVTVSYLDLEAQPRQLHAHGLLARALQHELDHLQGVLFVDKVSPIKKIGLAASLRRMRQAKVAELGLAP